MKRGFCYLAMSFIAVSVLLSGCGAGIAAIQEVPAITVTAGASFDTIKLPAQVAVTLRDGSLGNAAVEWEVSKWAGKPLQESITVIGQVAGCKKQAMLRIAVQQARASSLWEGVICVDVCAGVRFDEIGLPVELEVTFSDGSVGKAPVVWDTANWSGKQLEKSIRLEGRVEHVATPALLVIAALPRMSDEESCADDAAVLMDARLGNDPAFYQVTWSPGQERVAFTLGTDDLDDEGQLFVWTTGTPVPVRPNGVLQQKRFYHGLSWSCDGKYLAVHDMMSGFTTMYIAEANTLEVVQTMGTWNTGYWSPDSPEYLVASLEGGEQPAIAVPLSRTTDLVLIDAATGSRRVLMKADSETFYAAEGWKGPGQAQYTRFYRLDVVQEALIVSTRR